MPDLPVSGPLGELHFRYRRGSTQWARLASAPGGGGLNGAVSTAIDFETSAELPAEGVVPPATRADFSGEPERAAFVVADEDRPDAFARAFGLGEPADDELLAPNAFGFPPVVRARPGPVGGRATLTPGW